jgi:hypothetical protein
MRGKDSVGKGNIIIVVDVLLVLQRMREGAKEKGKRIRE